MRSVHADGHVVIVSGPWAPEKTGSAVLMGNLLSAFDPASYTVITRRPGAAAQDQRVRPFLPRSLGRKRLLRWADTLAEPALVARIVASVLSNQAVAVVGVYPDLPHLAAAHRAAALTKRPCVVYLHDTVAEAASHGLVAQRSARVQEAVFRDATVLVMSQGMADLYASKYGLTARPVVHAYPEPIPTNPPTDEGDPALLWAGEVYRINQHAVARVADAAGRAGRTFRLATRRSPADLAAQGVKGDHVETTFFADRPTYLNAIARHSILVLALDDADESAVHRDELATIFPTKTPEYLATGRPILVHCPEDWFLARFFRGHGCGEVVSSRDPAALDAALRRLADPAVASKLGAAALRTAAHFKLENVSEAFARGVAQAR